MTSAAAELEHAARACAPDVLAALVRRYGDFDAAEDAVQEALVAAARQWPVDGLPDNPRGWLIRVASRRLGGPAAGRAGPRRPGAARGPARPTS